MKNIYFIEAKSPGAHIFSFTTLPRLGSILLGTILKEKGYNTKVFIEDIAPPVWNEIDDADMVCISSITSTANRAFQIAEKFKKLGVPVVLGGPHSTFLPEESLQYADYVVRGEGEETLVKFLDCLNSNAPLHEIKGLSYRNHHNEIIHNPDRELVKDLNTAPIPDFSLVYKWEKVNTVPIATSRGCPFGCKFCSVIPMFGRKYRFKSIERVIKEIEVSALNKGHVFFIDDNFAADRSRTKDLLRTIIDRNIKFVWSAQVRTDVAKDPELIRLMKKAGCFAVFIGFESINPETLDLYNKSQAIADIENSIRVVKQYNINIHGMFVLGSDTDDIQTIRNTAKFAKKQNIESIQFMVLTPLPGTPVFNELKSSGRLIHTDWSKYDAHHTVFEPSLMTAYELHIETLKAMAKFYSWGSVLRNLIRFDFFYASVGVYGIRSVKKALSGAKNYIAQLRDIITNEFDSKAERLRQLAPLKNGETKNIILNTEDLESDQLTFFSTFLSNLDKQLIITKKQFSVNKNVLSITPLVFHLKDRHEKGKQYIQDFYKKHRDNLDSSKVIDLEAISLFKSCFNIGLLLNVNTKKVRKAYERALKSIGGKEFECNHVLVMVG
jgi:radical SAM superfamily enzyme YgiQ (UPF0313 family)